MIQASLLQDIAFFVLVPILIVIISLIIFVEVEAMCEWSELIKQDAERELQQTNNKGEIQ